MTDPVHDIAVFINEQTDSWFPELKMLADVPVGSGANNLYKNDLPPTPDFAVAVLRYEGEPPDETFGNPLSVRNPRIQITVRHKSSTTALNRANDILERLALVTDQEINGTVYQRIRPVGEAFELGPDSSNRQLAVVNFRVSYYG